MPADELVVAAKPVAWPSIDDVEPDEEGGPIARIGFNYQDEIAVAFLLEMLETPSLLKVHCETHDDIVLVSEHSDNTTRTVEFVQVKGGAANKLWSLADLCQQSKKTPGTSIFEKSLSRDKHDESACFRLVTLRPVNSDLEILTYSRGLPGRAPDCERFKTLHAELESRFPGHQSPKGNGTEFWLEACYWDQRYSEEAVRKDNLLHLIKISVAEGHTLLPEQAEQVLDDLRAMAKAAGAAKWAPNPEKKIILRSVLRSWWEARAHELSSGAATTSGGKLTTKMQEANLPGDVINLAIELRRTYSEASRTSRYLEQDEGQKLQGRVKSEVMSLRSQLVSGQLSTDGAGFHALCIERMDAINAERREGTEDHSAYLKGCMYDIADRCLLRFVRPQ